MKPLILLAIFSFLNLTACSVNMGGPAKIPQCDSTWALMPLVLPHADKTDLSTSEPNLPAGRYDATTTQLYYWDKKADIKMEFTTTIDAKTSAVKFEINCLGGEGISHKMEPMTFAVPFVSNMLVDASGKTNLSTRSMTIELGYVPGLPLIRTRSDNVSSGVQGSIKETYTGYPTTSNLLFKVNPTVYQTRTQLKSNEPTKAADDHFDIRILVGYVKDRPVTPR